MNEISELLGRLIGGFIGISIVLFAIFIILVVLLFAFVIFTKISGGILQVYFINLMQKKGFDDGLNGKRNFFFAHFEPFKNPYNLGYRDGIDERLLYGINRLSR